MTGWIWWIIVGLIAGWATGRIMKGSGYGPIMDIVLGIIGAVIGGWIMTALGIGAGGLIWSIIVAIIGAVILVWIVRLITGNRSAV
ncbi:MAG: GlsB/YeaQ/YmgE family stress response membrane protein [Gemmatimonadaceae bacterium]